MFSHRIMSSSIRLQSNKPGTEMVVSPVDTATHGVETRTPMAGW